MGYQQDIDIPDLNVWKLMLAAAPPEGPSLAAVTESLKPAIADTAARAAGTAATGAAGGRGRAGGARLGTAEEVVGLGCFARPCCACVLAPALGPPRTVL